MYNLNTSLRVVQLLLALVTLGLNGYGKRPLTLPSPTQY